jgi:hypothetical protein
MIFRLRLLITGILAVSALSLASADQPQVTGNGSPASREQESLEVRYARAHAKIANLDYLRFLKARENFPESLPLAAGADLKRHVAIDEEQLKQAMKGPDADIHEIYIRSAKLGVELAKRDLQRKRKASQQFPGELQALAVQRAEAVAELAQLHLEVTLKKKAAISSMVYLKWQIDILRNQLLELQVAVKSQIQSD